MLYNSINSLIGFKLIESDIITKDVQARRHKKKRINKKWLKRYGLKTVPDYETIYVITPCGEKCIIAQPKTIEKIKEIVKKEGE